ncbi:CBS domain-containing protein [Belnapia sp. T18]|uniref:CBS domain-containing protein n=1 Tax=Belnapia arida TaxID=2804533 RepID=A0ABS1UB23_9PROT|nr:CBS domain-containing protein [Belnapia arida]MBL6081129.1 CBS domain-containing protein [Belnapia arida]
MLPRRKNKEDIMTSLCARDVMTAGMTTVSSETPVAAIARMFSDRGISAVAVTDTAGTLLGIVTESDLIRRLADEDDQPSGWLSRLFDSPVGRADRYARSHGVKASEVMTERVVTASPRDSAAHVARIMENHRIRRVPITEDGKLLGVVARSDLVRALVSQEMPQADNTTDDEIHRAIIAAMQREPWADTVHTAVHVQDGVVEIFGFSRSEAVSRALYVLAENVPGVKRVVDRTSSRNRWEPA